MRVHALTVVSVLLQLSALYASDEVIQLVFNSSKAANRDYSFGTSAVSICNMFSRTTTWQVDAYMRPWDTCDMKPGGACISCVGPTASSLQVYVADCLEPALVGKCDYRGFSAQVTQGTSAMVGASYMVTCYCCYSSRCNDAAALRPLFALPLFTLLLCAKFIRH